MFLCLKKISKLSLCLFLLFGILTDISVFGDFFVDDGSLSGFAGGSFNNTQFSADSVSLDATGLSNGYGEYLSEVKNTGSISTFDNLTWTPSGPYQKNIPNNDLSEIVSPSPDIDIAFDESVGSTIFVDSSGNGVNLTCSCGTCPTAGTAGQFGNSVSFDGFNDQIDIPNNDLINTGGPYSNRTIMLWFRTTTTSGNQMIYEQGGGSRGFNIYLVDNNLYVGGWNDAEYGWPGTWLSTTINSNQWYHVALVLRGAIDSLEPDVFEAYLNGVEFGSGDGGRIHPHGDNIGLGGLNGSTKTHTSLTFNNYTGRIDEFKLFNNFLTLSQINEYYLSNTPSPSSTIYAERNIPNSANVFLSHFEKTGSVTSFVDSSGNNQSLTCSGSGCPTTESEGRIKNGLYFDGGDEILVANSNEINSGGPYNNRTISFWFKADNLVGNQMLFEEGGTIRGLNVYLQNNTLYAGGWNEVEYGWPGTWLSTTINSNQWYHVALVLRNAVDSLEPEKLFLYVNGVEVDRGSGGYLYSHTGDIRIGNSGDTKTHNSGIYGNFTGYIDEFAIHNSSYNDTGVFNLYKRGALSLKFQVRSCNDSACVGEDFVGPDGTASSYFYDDQDLVLPSHSLNVIDNSHFQYKAIFETIDSSISPFLNLVSIEYTPRDIPFLAFQIKDPSDTSSLNICDMQTVSTLSTTSCSYRLSISTNAVNGYRVYVQSSGDLTNGIYNISSAAAGSGGTGGNDISASTLGIEKYGVKINPGSSTSGVISLNPMFDAGTNFVNYSYTAPQEIYSSTGSNAPTSPDLTNTALVEHNLNIADDTLPGYYTQSLIYTVVPEF